VLAFEKLSARQPKPIRIINDLIYYKLQLKNGQAEAKVDRGVQLKLRLSRQHSSIPLVGRSCYYAVLQSSSLIPFIRLK